MDSMQPGQVIVPRAADEPEHPIPPAQPNPGAPDPGRGQEPDDEPLPTPPPGSEPEPTTLAATGNPEPDSPWQFRQTQESPASMPAALDDITWASPEFVDHDKGARWYGMVAGVGIAAAALDYFLIKDWFSMGVIVFGVIALAAYGARKPKEQQYALTHQGLQIGRHLYGFQEFKNFSITEEGGFASIVFMPLRRFMPALTVHVDPEIEDRVVDFLAAVLPFEEHRGDMVEGLMRRIRF